MVAIAVMIIMISSMATLYSYSFLWKGQSGCGRLANPLNGVVDAAVFYPQI